MEQNDTKVFKVINGNSYELLKDFPDNYFDAIVTDPPYGLGKEPDANETLKAWIETGYIEVKGSGFMGKEWDAFVPQPIFWKEVFRVLKHGGHVLAFYGTRTYDWGVMAMRFAGFEVRDCIQWLYGSGFPKSHNISKAIDKMYGAEREVLGSKITGTMNNKGGASVNKEGWDGGQKEVEVTAPSTDQAKEWDGWGSALKPANEPIVLARKPLEKGLSIAENVLKWGTGAINIDGCRVNTNGEKIDSHITKGQPFLRNSDEYEQIDRTSHTNGRFPANLILTHHEDCVCKGTKKVKAIKGGVGERSKISNGNINWKPSNTGSKGDEDGNETVENWDCHEDCPIKILDEQSGVSKSVIRKPNGKAILNVEKGWNNNSMVDETIRGINDKGGASRFFKTFSQDDIHYCYLCGKANKNELWKNNYNNVLNAVSNLKSTSQMKEPIVQENVTESLRKKADLTVKNVANLCDLCVTNFVQEVVEINNLDSKKEQLTLMQDFIQDCRKCTLLQNLVCYVEMMDNIDTTPITQSLLKLFGYAWTAIENYINKDIKEVEAQKLGLTRFQYQAKASKSERNKGLDGFEEKTNMRVNAPRENELEKVSNKMSNFHPTVKPIKLMQYLVRLVTPPNGIVLDPFCGSGTTGIACKLEGFDFVGMEQDAEYCKIADARIKNYTEEKQNSVKIKIDNTQLDLF